MTDRRREFIGALDGHAAAFGAGLDAGVRERLADYFELVGRWNKQLHLVAPCAPEEFATRHVLESLLAAEHMSHGARFIDIGSGAGLPAIPCLVARPDLSATLVEASAKKCVFLREAAAALDLRERMQVINSRFETTPPLEADAVTCRALERFAEMLPKILDWSPPSARLLLFGGPALGEAIERAGRTFDSVLMPESEQRFLFVIQAQTKL
ncbi:MAG TPA: 16S rRNA (guanine(527)-N(7))-methyltransferase RsmG [Pyrinomonadaceae bacterium]|nr:16S rRNA (guanine(527)-N(7))-methyltransferase RsmG [Pyrinomonadaceae bacterium]